MRQTTVAALAALYLGGMSAAVAQTNPGSGYMTDQRGEVVRSGSGLCWRTSAWTPASASAACEADLAAPAAGAAAAPAAAAAGAAAAPAAAAAAPKKCDFTVTLANDETFDFDRAKLKPAAIAKLDRDVLARLNSCASLKLVLITGHTDRLGQATHNQKLSEQRAEAVRAYLAGKGVPGDSMDTMGAGKTQPVSGLRCDDALQRQALIACLAPNRRVTIEVQGPAR
ncbi:MAG: OmpA family protein [Rhodocyclaceae bacterium]|nr:OmpA family protein [Rhodocyclaceae bacterium]